MAFRDKINELVQGRVISPTILGRLMGRGKENCFQVISVRNGDVEWIVQQLGNLTVSHHAREGKLHEVLLTHRSNLKIYPDGNQLIRMHFKDPDYAGGGEGEGVNILVPFPRLLEVLSQQQYEMVMEASGCVS